MNKKKTFILLSLLIMAMTAIAQDSSTFKQRPGKLLSLKMPCRLLKGITERDYSIYLPGSYEEDTLRQYPVLYLMQCGGGSHTDY